MILSVVSMLLTFGWMWHGRDRPAMAQVDVQPFIAHVLTTHLSVPEPVRFEIRELWPSENCAQAQMIGVPEFPRAWRVEYDRACWLKHPHQRQFVIAHELCHAAYEYDQPGWDKLSPKERKRRDHRADLCALQILRDHKGCPR